MALWENIAKKEWSPGKEEERKLVMTRADHFSYVLQKGALMRILMGRMQLHARFTNTKKL
jgi:hypothetical protein